MLTQEQLKIIEGLLVAAAPTPATAAVRNRLLTVRDAIVKSLAAVNGAIDLIDGNASVPEIPIPPSLEPPAEAPKKSAWAKVGGFFRKVWPVASVALLAVPGGAAIAGVVNATMGAGTADPTTAGVAGLLVPIGAAIVKARETAKE